MKLLVIGAGGIGSHIVEYLCRCLGKDILDPRIEITVADSDIIELDQMKYQNFKMEEVGLNKANALSDRFKDYGITPIKKRIEKESQLKGYDFIMLCVDNEKSRELVIKYCHKKDVEFIDLRATGRNIFAMPKEKQLSDNLKFVDSKDTKEYSCQDKRDLEKGWVQLGNEIIALWGCQMFLNHIRGYGNRIFSKVI